MVLPAGEDRSQWIRLLIAFLVGLLVGWWVIGWGVWPVTWTNALPQDLRAAERDQYLIMTAESYAATGNLDLARERLAGYSQGELKRDFNVLLGRLTTENAAQAAQVQRLAAALGVYTPPAPSAASPATPSLLRRIGSWVIWVVGVLLGAAVVYILWLRLRASQAGEIAPAIGGPARQVGPPAAVGYYERTAEEVAEEAKRAWPERAEPVPTGEGEELPPFLAREEREPPAPAAVPAPAPASGAPIKIGDFLAAYEMGDLNYDEKFDITDSSEVYLGECGMALDDPLDHQAAALQVWMRDINDPATRAKVLMSEGVYRDTALRDRLARGYPVVVTHPGDEFELETYNLIMRGTIEKVEYAEQEPVHGIFVELVVRMRVYRKG